MCFDSETELWLVEGSDDVITGTCQKWVITFTGAAERHEHQSEQELVLLFTQGHATTLCTHIPIQCYGEVISLFQSWRGFCIPCATQ